MVRLSPTMEFESPDGCRAFDYYRSQSAPVLSNIMDSEFWGGLVMRLSVTEPIVRHAVLAMSSLHEHLSTNRQHSTGVGPAFVYSEYSKSISALRKWKSSDGPTIPLLACVLYTCLEFLLDNENAARMHILQGRQLLGSIDDDSSPAMEMVKRDLVPMYTRLGLAAFLYGGHPPTVPDHLRPSMAPRPKFDSMAEARSLLYHLLDEAMRFSTTAKPKVYTSDPTSEDMRGLFSTQQEILTRLNHWNTTFVIYTSGTKMTQAATCTQNLLLIYYNTAVVWVSTALSRHEVAFDAHITSFATIVSLAASIIGSAQRGPPLHSFSFETELIAPIYWTAQKCRHPMLRRAAVKLLMKDVLKNRRENLWHSNEAIAISLRTIEIEEESISRGVVVITDDTMDTSPDTASHETPRSEASSKDSQKSNFCVPIFQPPTISVEEVEEDALLEELLDFNDLPGVATARNPQEASTLAKVLSLHAGAAHLESPYGIHELARLKNVIIGSRNQTGVWVTLFRDPEAEEEQWDIRKEFIAFL